MISFKLTLDTRRKKKNNTYPLIFRISTNHQSRDIKIGHSISEHEWNPKTETLRKTALNYDSITGKINELRVKYLDKIIQFERTHPWQLNPQELKDYLLSDYKPVETVYECWQQ